MPEESDCTLAVGFIEQKVQFSRRRIDFDLPVPRRLITFTEPAREAAEVFRRKSVYDRFDLFHPVHTWSLS